MAPQAILAAAQRNLDRWKESALGSVSSLVEMERDFVTAAFFRHAVAQRSAHMQQLEQMHDIMDSAPLDCTRDSMCTQNPSRPLLNTRLTGCHIKKLCFSGGQRYTDKR